jgi:catechol 2,3-dioxygenase-like lactoylglutathione lyase family enzyme
MLAHVGIPVSDFERSKRFYEQALSPLGYELIMEPRRGANGLGRSGEPDFWVLRGEPGRPRRRRRPRERGCLPRGGHRGLLEAARSGLSRAFGTCGWTPATRAGANAGPRR